MVKFWRRGYRNLANCFILMYNFSKNNYHPNNNAAHFFLSCQNNLLLEKLSRVTPQGEH